MDREVLEVLVMDNVSFMENMSLFDQQENNASNGMLDVVKMNFEEAERMTWKELFSGFDEMHAITYSSGIGFVYKLLNMFEKAEIIFGYDEIMSFQLQEIMAYQCKLIERIKEKAGKAKLDLISKIEDETLHLYVANTVLSHEKIYLLSAKDGRKRVIMGSANMSLNAFGGRQRENICYIDGGRAYDWYMSCYEELKESSTDQIVKESLLFADDGENIDQLPIAKTVKVKKAMVIEPIAELKEEVQFALDVKNLAKNIAPSVPKPDKKGKLLLSTEKITIARRQIANDKQLEKEKRSEYPQLEIFVDDSLVRLNSSD
ncbi:MAG: NgoFVII family restriction endonuclease, partial [Oscillospiraceae bacterium]|nr:NgoFVII family restriction endonuclease [Oscillospiraceae bacterium]